MSYHPDEGGYAEYLRDCGASEADIRAAVEAPMDASSATVASSLSFKGAGNDLFQAGDFAGAIGQYTLALDASRAEGGRAHAAFISRLLSNRALCYLKTGAFAACERDADLAFSLDSNNDKALRHRGVARQNMPSRRAEALVDLEQYVSAHPEDAKAARLLDGLRRRSDGAAKVASSSASTTSSPSLASSPTSASSSCQKVPYTVEKIGEGEIFAMHRISFTVPRAQISKLKGGSATVQVRGGSFALEAVPEASAVETIIESPDPTPAADAIAERIYRRIHSDTAPPGMEVCVVS